MANVKVAVRVRPMSRRELELGAEMIVNINGDTASITNLKVPENSEVDSRERIRHFVFDFCYWSVMPSDPHNVTQEMIFDELGRQMLESALDGYNACILAYGQSGSGKTYTMMGMDEELGLIPRICENLFTNVSERSNKKVTFHADVSYLEIYNERVCDLLQNPFPHKNRTSLKVREHPKYGPYVQDLSKHDVSDFQTVLSLIEKGNQNRSVASTESHSRSSRSHAIFTINFTQACLDAEMPSEIVSKIHLVDLAGSERASIKFNRTRLKEGSNINKSLVTLGNVISALAEKSLSTWSLDSLGSTYSLESMGSSPASSPRRIRQTFVPYRDSVLTWLLKDSLGGNSKTIMIATISPASTCYSETVGTLHYAQRAKCIVNKPVINEDSTVKLIRELRAEISRLRELLANAQTHNVINSPRDEVSIAEILNENERNAFTLTQTWMEKWQESGHLVEDSEMSILKSKSSVIVDSYLPHLIVLDNHILSTGIKIYYLKHGKTRIGNDSSRCADVGVLNCTLLPEHCELDFDGTNVTLSPLPGATCFINDFVVREPTLLRQADIVKLGFDLTLRFNHPSEVRKLIKEKNQENVMIKSQLHFICDNEQNFGFTNWHCHECLLNRCNGATTSRHCPLHMYCFPICRRQFYDSFSATASCDDDKLKVAIHHLDSSNSTCSCSFAKDFIRTDRLETCCRGNGSIASIGCDSAITENNCKNSEALPGDRIQVTPLIFQHLKNESMSADMVFIGDFDGANCPVKLPNAVSDSNICYHNAMDKYCAFSTGANTQIMTWTSPHAPTQTLNSKLFMDNLVCRPRLAARKLCQDEDVTKNSIVMTEQRALIGDSTSEARDKVFQHSSDEVCSKNKQVNCVKEVSKPFIKIENKEFSNEFLNNSIKREGKLQFQHNYWKTRRKFLKVCETKIERKKTFKNINKLRKTNVNGCVRSNKKRLCRMFTKQKIWENDDCLMRECRTKNKISNSNKKADLEIPSIQLDLFNGTNHSILNSINSSSHIESISSAGLLNNVQQFVNFVKEITDSEQLVKVLANSNEEQKYSVEREKSITNEELNEIPAIKEEEINQSQIEANVFAPVDKNCLSVTSNDSELKRTLSNNDIHQSLNSTEVEQSEENNEQQPTKVRTSSWSEPSQMSLEQLDSEIKDLQENLKVDLVNEVLDNIEDAILLCEQVPSTKENAGPNKKLVRQSAKLCSSPDLMENERATQVQKRPLRMIGGIMSQSVSLDEEEMDCGHGQWFNKWGRGDTLSSTTSLEEMDVEFDLGSGIVKNKSGNRAPPLVFITQPSDSFSESGVVMDKNLDLDLDREKDNFVDEDEEMGSGRFDDNQSVELRYSDDFESDESDDDESGNEDCEDNGIESDEDIFYIPIDQLRGFSPPQIAVDKELVFELEGFSRTGQGFNSTQSCQVRHEGASDQLKNEREEFTTSNIQANANGESLRFGGYYHNKELAASPQNLSKDKTKCLQSDADVDLDLTDEDSKLLIDFSTPCDLLNEEDEEEEEEEEDDVFSSASYTLSPMDVLIDYRMISPGDRHRLYTIPELSSEYSSTPTEGILGSMSEADVACLDEEEENGRKSEISTLQNETEAKNNDDRKGEIDSQDKLFHNKCCEEMESNARDPNELNAMHGFQPQFDSSVVNPGIGLDSKSDLGADTGDESSSSKKTGHLLIMQSDSAESTNNTLEGETGAGEATVQAPAACRELWKLYKQFSEDSEDEGEVKGEVQEEVKKEAEQLETPTNCGSQGEKEVNDPDGKCVLEIEANISNSAVYSVMSPYKARNSNMSHDVSIKASARCIEQTCDKITENENKIIIDNEILENVNKTVNMNNEESFNDYSCGESLGENPREVSSGVCSLEDVVVNIFEKSRCVIGDRCVQRVDESCEGRMNNVENECVLTEEISNGASGGLSNQMSNRCSDQQMEISNENEKANGETGTSNLEKNPMECDVGDDISLSQRKKMLQLSEITWTKANQWIHPERNCDILPPIKVLKTSDSEEDKENPKIRERSMTPDSLDEGSSSNYTVLKSLKIGQASPSTPTNVLARSKLSPLAGPRNLYTKNSDLGAFSDLWGASTDSITFVFLGPASTFGQEGLFTRNLRSPRSPGRCHALSNSWKLKHESLLPRSVSLDCINRMVQYSLTTRAASMESMIPEDLMNVVEKGRLHGIDLEEMRGSRTPESTTPDFCRALKYHTHSNNNSFLLPSRAFSQGSVIDTPVSSKKSLAFERKTKKSVSWSDLSGQELAMEEGSITKQRHNSREIKPIIKKVESGNYIHSDCVSSSLDYTETDAEEDLKKCALFTKIQKKRNPAAWVIAPQTQSFALKLPDHVKARIKPPPLSKEKVEEVVVKNEIETTSVVEKSNLNEVCQSPTCEVGSKSISCDTSSNESARAQSSEADDESEARRPPLAQMMEKLLANKEIVEEVQRMDNVNQLNNNMKNASFVVPSSDYDWARLSVILSEASVFFQQLSTFCANRTKLVAHQPDQNAIKDNKTFKFRDIETQTNDAKSKMDSATTTDNFSPGHGMNLSSVLEINGDFNFKTHKSNGEDFSVRKVDSAVQVDTLQTKYSEEGRGYRFRSKWRREACLKKELEILTEEKGRIMKALVRCRQQNGYLNGNVSADEVTTSEDELSPPDNPDYLVSYQARLDTACKRVLHKLEKLKETKETELHSCSSPTNSSMLNSSLSYSTEYLPIVQQSNLDGFESGRKNGLRKYWQQKQLHTSTSSLSSSTKSQSSDYLKPQHYCSQLINIRRNVVAASRNTSAPCSKTLNADNLKKLQSQSIKEEILATKCPDKPLENTAKDIENLLWECQAARHRAQHEIELAQEQLKCQRMAVQNLASVLQQKA